VPPFGDAQRDQLGRRTEFERGPIEGLPSNLSRPSSRTDEQPGGMTGHEALYRTTVLALLCLLANDRLVEDGSYVVLAVINLLVGWMIADIWIARRRTIKLER
jgi:hypothetical protein